MAISLRIQIPFNTSNAFQKELENGLRFIDTIQTRTIERFTTEVEKPIYKECIVPSSGIEILNTQVEELNKSIRGEVIK